MVKEIGVAGDFHNSGNQCAISDSIEYSDINPVIKAICNWIDTSILDNENYSE